MICKIRTHHSFRKYLTLGAVILLGIVTLVGSGGGGGGDVDDDDDGDGDDTAPALPSSVQYGVDFGGLLLTIDGVTLRTGLGLHGVFHKTSRHYTLDASLSNALTGLIAELEPADGLPTLEDSGEIQIQLVETLQFTYGSPPVAGALRLGGGNHVIISVNNNVDGSGQAGVDLEYIAFGATEGSSSHPWEEFAGLMNDGAAPNYQRAASTAWFLLRIVYDHVQTLMEQTQYLTENDAALAAAGGNVGVDSACNLYSLEGSQGTRHFIWTDGPGADSGELGPGDNFSIDFSECYLNRDDATPGTLYRDGVVRLNDYLEIRAPFALGFFDTRFEALRSERADKDNGEPLPGTEVIAESFRLLVNNVPDDSLGFQFVLQPDASTIINVGNAAEVTEAAINGLLLPPQVGTLTLDLFIDVLAGAPVGEYCAAGGSYDVTPDPFNADAPAPGKAYLMEFANCGLADGETTLDGALTLTIDSLSGTLQAGATYAAAITLAPIGLTLTDPVGPSTLSGATGFSRSATADNNTESSSAVAGNPLGIAEAEFSSVLAQYTVASSLTIASGAYSYGAAGQQATIDRSDIPGALTIQVEQAIAGTGDNPPDSGRIRITAEDDGRLTITIEDGQLSLALDADGDGTVDDTIGPVDWADLID